MNEGDEDMRENEQAVVYVRLSWIEYGDSSIVGVYASLAAARGALQGWRKEGAGWTREDDGSGHYIECHDIEQGNVPSEPVHVDGLGADPTGVTDSAPAFQAAYAGRSAQ